MKIRSAVPALLLGLVLPLLASAPAQAQAFHHPDYRHAVVELRDAHWLFEHRYGGPLEERERRALHEIERTLEDVERSAQIDGSFRYEGPRMNEYAGPARLRRVSELLRAARYDIAQEEDVLPAREAQYRALGHLDEAIRITEDVMVEREHLHDYYEHEHREHDMDRDVDRR
jgi:hypothetical protein